MQYADIVVENKSKYIDKYFTYSTGDFHVEVGDKVEIPFISSKKMGYVFDLKDKVTFDSGRIKTIIGVDKDESLNEEMIKTCIWMKQRYAVKYIDGIHCFTPPGKVSKKGKKKEAYKDVEGKYVKPERLTEEQEVAVEQIEKAIEDGDGTMFLLHGVTASGKTEVYMEAIEKTLSLGKTAIMLVPEISLTNQIIETFIGKFGRENIGVLHSKLTARERYDQWVRIKKGHSKVVIGARMAVFAPLENIGLIILDEEHEATYKADRNPKYDTVDIAAKRLRYYGGILVLGSATPSITSYQRVRDGIYKLIELKERYNKTPLPKVKLVDMREELHQGNTSIFSEALQKEMKEALRKEEQIILLQNRRGYANFVSCRECGNVIKCPDCDISLTYHKTGNYLQCHYCGRKEKVATKCPECGSRYIRRFGIGTEQVEEKVRDLFPDIKVDRLDLDSIKRRRDLDSILHRFSKNKTQILVGTQLVAKGLDFHNVGLVGVISADTTLNIPDFRSEERTFQLISQVSGRAGRGEKQGKVIVQTYAPENHALKTAQNHDYKSFFLAETAMRKLMDYPPFGIIIEISFLATSKQISIKWAEECKSYMEKYCTSLDGGKVLIPKLTSIMQEKGKSDKEKFKYCIILKCPNESRNKYMYYLDKFNNKLLERKIDCHMGVDVNPYSL